MLRVIIGALWTLCVVPSGAIAGTCPNGSPQIVQTGQVSPCEGVLLSSDDALTLAGNTARLAQAKARGDSLEARLRASEARLVAERQRCTETTAACDREVAKLRLQLQAPSTARPTPLVERPWFVATMTILVTAAITVPVTWLVVSGR